MADMNTLISAIGDAIAGASAVSSWSLLTYEEDITVYENCDARQDPPESACPLIIVSPVEKRAGMSRDAKELLVGVSVIVFDESTETSLAGVIRYVGGRRLEELRKLVLAAVAGAVTENLMIMGVDTEYNLIEQFPFVSANMIIELAGTRTIGQTTYE